MKSDDVYFAHILQAIDRIYSYAEKGKKPFLKDIKTQDAIVRNFEIIGEACRNLSTSTKKKYPDIPWQRIISTRNKMIHEYFDLDLELTWEMIQKRLPELKKEIKKINKDL